MCAPLWLHYSDWSACSSFTLEDLELKNNISEKVERWNKISFEIHSCIWSNIQQSIRHKHISGHSNKQEYKLIYYKLVSYHTWLRQDIEQVHCMTIGSKSYTFQGFAWCNFSTLFSLMHQNKLTTKPILQQKKYRNLA